MKELMTSPTMGVLRRVWDSLKFEREYLMPPFVKVTD